MFLYSSQYRSICLSIISSESAAMMLFPSYDDPELALKYSDSEISWVCPAMAQPTGNETICPSPSKDCKQIYLSTITP